MNVLLPILLKDSSSFKWSQLESANAIPASHSCFVRFKSARSCATCHRFFPKIILQYLDWSFKTNKRHLVVQKLGIPQDSAGHIHRFIGACVGCSWLAATSADARSVDDLPGRSPSRHGFQHKVMICWCPLTWMIRGTRGTPILGTPPNGGLQQKYRWSLLYSSNGSLSRHFSHPNDMFRKKKIGPSWINGSPTHRPKAQKKGEEGGYGCYGHHQQIISDCTQAAVERQAASLTSSSSRAMRASRSSICPWSCAWGMNGTWNHGGTLFSHG